MILGTTDAIESDHHNDLIEKAEKYAIRFNAEILGGSEDFHIAPAHRND